MSGFSMYDVRVHYNSNKPAQIQTHAYAQGTDIHVTPGQEKHLSHEAARGSAKKQGIGDKGRYNGEKIFILTKTTHFLIQQNSVEIEIFCLLLKVVEEEVAYIKLGGSLFLVQLELNVDKNNVFVCIKVPNISINTLPISQLN